MLPTLSRLSVSLRPAPWLPPWSSCRSLRISPLHRQFEGPLRSSSDPVCHGLPRLSRGLSHDTEVAACARFTPSDSGQRSPPLSYRGCWHRVSRGLFRGYRQGRPPEKRFTTRRPSSRTRRCSVRLAPIAENSLLLPPVGVWAVSQSQSGWSSSQTSYPSSAW